MRNVPLRQTKSGDDQEEPRCSVCTQLASDTTILSEEIMPDASLVVICDGPTCYQVARDRALR